MSNLLLESGDGVLLETGDFLLLEQDGDTPVLTAGTASATAGDSQVSLSATEPTGGTAPYTYQWYRSTDGTKGSALTGATSRSHEDTGLVNGTEYFYTLDATDAASASVSYTQVSATPVEPTPAPPPSSTVAAHMRRRRLAAVL